MDWRIASCAARPEQAALSRVPRVDWQHILYSVDDGVAHIVLNRPEKLNALGIGAGSNRQELVDALELADRDD